MRLPIEVEQRSDVICTGDETGKLGNREWGWEALQMSVHYDTVDGKSVTLPDWRRDVKTTSTYTFAQVVSGAEI